MRSAGFRIEKLHHVNALGVLGWFLNSRVLADNSCPKANRASLISPLLQR